MTVSSSRASSSSVGASSSLSGPLVLAFAGTPYTVAGGPFATAVGYLDADLNLDIAVATTTGKSVDVLMGNGDGTFKPAVHYAVSDTAYSVVLADLNMDGKLDAATANLNGKSCDILTGKGDGTFNPATTVSLGTAVAYDVAAADLTNDGIPDLVFADHRPSPQGGTAVLVGKGDGTFDPVKYSAGDAHAIAVAVGSLNGVSLQVVTAAFYVAMMDVFSNNLGTLSLYQTFALKSGSNPHDVALADLNHDGRLDAVLADENTLDIAVFTNTGTNFSGPSYFPLGATHNPGAVAVADFDLDGHPDVAAALESGNLGILLGNGTGALGAASRFATSQNGTIGLTVGDLDRDGKPDAILSNLNSNSITVFLNRSHP